MDNKFREIVMRAAEGRYAVPAINIFDQVSMASVLEGAAAARSPIIVQTSVKTVKQIGGASLIAMWRDLTDGISVPAALHLDHCPDRAVISECLRLGWDSVLYDAHHLPIAENLTQTIEVVREAREHGAGVEGEIEAITGVEDGHGSDVPGQRQSLETQLDFIRSTGVDAFAPALGNAHGVYAETPDLDYARVADIFGASGIPLALHGGSGLEDDQFRRMIHNGVSKINISTALKRTYMQIGLAHLKDCEDRDVWEPLALLDAQSTAMRGLVRQLATVFGSEGEAE